MGAAVLGAHDDGGREGRGRGGQASGGLVAAVGSSGLSGVRSLDRGSVAAASGGGGGTCRSRGLGSFLVLELNRIGAGEAAGWGVLGCPSF